MPDPPAGVKAAARPGGGRLAGREIPFGLMVKRPDPLESTPPAFGEQAVRQILREAEETDRREDELYGDARGDELPEQLRSAEGRRAALADSKRRIEGAQRPPGRPAGT